MKTFGRIARILGLMYLGAWLVARAPATYHVMTVDIDSGTITTGFEHTCWRFALPALRCSNIGPACSHPHRWHLKRPQSGYPTTPTHTPDTASAS
jgi:hypothetical protein